MRRGRSAFTTRASCLLAAGATALLCGLVLGVTDLVRAGVLALAVPLVAAVVVHRSRFLITNQRLAEPSRTSAGGSVVMHLTITNRSVLQTGSLMLEDQLPSQLTGHARFVIDRLAGRESRTVSYRMPDLPRGRYYSGPLQVRLTDPFHMVDLTRAFTARSAFTVMPIVEALPRVDPPRSQDIGDNAGSHSVGIHGADDASTREYRTGDDLRKIHWRSSARTGSLMVRQEERPWQGHSTLLVDLRSIAHASVPVKRGDKPAADERLRSSLEWSVSAAASIGTHILLAGRELSIATDPAHPQRVTMHDPSALGEHLAAARPTHQPDLSPFAGMLGACARDSALIALVGALDPTSLHTLADARPRGLATPALVILVAGETWTGSDAPGKECLAAARALRIAGWQVAVARCGEPVAHAWREVQFGGGAALHPTASVAGG